MKDFNKIIDNWVNKYTVPCTTIPEKSQIESFKKMEIDRFNRLIKEGKLDKDANKNDFLRNALGRWFGARFIKYKNEHRIILKDKNFKNDFYICSWSNHDLADVSIKDLVYELLDPEIEEGDSWFDNSYWVVIQDINDLLNLFNINYKFNEPIECDWRVENGKYEFSGDGWDTSGKTAFEESDLFVKVKEYITNKLEYEYDTYTKYNPTFDFLNIDNPINKFDDIFNKLNKQQIINILIKKCYDDKSIADEYTNKKEFIKLLNSIDDMDLIKQIIKSLKIKEDTFVHLCNRIYNI